MASIRKEIAVDAPAEHVWAAIRDVGAVHTRLAQEFVLDTQLDGDSRLVTFANGEVVRERIVDVDDRARRLAYAVVDWRTTHHNASFQVEPEGDDRCRLVWITDLLPDTLAELVGGFIDQGSAAMTRTLEARPRSDAPTSRETRMADQRRKADQFRALHVPGEPLVLFNIWDAGGAKAVAAGGARAIDTGSWSVANANGFADGERIPLTLAIDNLRRIVGATDLPVTIDLESGYGDASEVVGETIGLAIDAGAVGCNLEDSFPADGRLRRTVDQGHRIRRARQTADAARIRFFINARTDVFFQRPPEQHDDAMLVEAIERARTYAEAGADGLFAPGLTDITLIARLAEASPLPLNIMVGDATPPLRALAAHGVARVSHGPRPYVIAMNALEQAARAARA